MSMMKGYLVIVAGLALVGGSLVGCGGSGPGNTGPTGGGARAGTTGSGGQGGGVVGCGLTCAQYGVDCGMYTPPQCNYTYDCGTCPGTQVCGGSGTPNHCGATGTWRPDSTIQSVLFGDVDTVWGTGPTNIWAGDSLGRVAIYDGTSWQPAVNFGSSEGVTVITGSGPTNVWIGTTAGFAYQLVGANLVPHQVSDINDPVLDLWTSGPSDAWAATQNVLVRWDGQTLGPVSTPDPLDSASVWGVPGGPKWAVGSTGWIDQANASGVWQNVFPSGSHRLGTVRGFDASSVWAAGDTLLHWDGIEWLDASVNGGNTLLFPVLYGVWARTKTDVWAVGTSGLGTSTGGGLIVHGDGQFFDVQPSPTTEDLLSIWGSGPYDIWVGTTGAAGSILHYTAN
jgi:hypothetical protein